MPVGMNEYHQLHAVMLIGEGIQGNAGYNKMFLLILIVTIHDMYVYHGNSATGGLILTAHVSTVLHRVAVE